MVEAPHKKIIILAGPNGAGKTTFARAFLPQEAGVPRFINADLIAAGLAPFAPERAAIQAGRLMLDEIQRSTDRGKGLGRETMNPKDISSARNPDQRASLVAMQRAAQMARQIAIQTNTAIILHQDGKMVRITANQLREQDLAGSAADRRG